MDTKLALRAEFIRVLEETDGDLDLAIDLIGETWHEILLEIEQKMPQRPELTLIQGGLSSYASN